MRFETPNPRNISISLSPPYFFCPFTIFNYLYKWDSQLLVLHPEEPIQFDTIKKFLYEKSNIKANQATQQQVLSDTNFVHQTEKITQDILIFVICFFCFLRSDTYHDRYTGKSNCSSRRLHKGI
jgi:hypothetical protein